MRPQRVHCICWCGGTHGGRASAHRRRTRPPHRLLRFTDREQSWLFQAIQCHVTAASAAAAGAASAAAGAAGDDDGADNPALGLVEDGLKMPFTVFTTSHKKSMLRWLEKLKDPGSAGGGAAAATSTTVIQWTVSDLDASTAKLYDDGGSELDVRLAGSDEALVQRLRELFEAGEAVQVTLAPPGSGEGEQHLASVQAMP